MKIRYSRASILSLLLTLLVSQAVASDGDKSYRYDVDLTHIVKDRYQVTLDASDFASSMTGDQLTYLFPRVIPGTYRVADYGKYIKKFKAYDAVGNGLKVKREGKNNFIISDSDRLATITYWVADTWDARRVRNRVYPMAGTNTDEGSNFVVNAAGVFGFFRGHVANPIIATFERPAGLYAQTALTSNMIGMDKVRFEAKNYHHLVDSPIMFSMPDTVGFNVKNTQVTIGVDSKIKTANKSQDYFHAISPSLVAVGDFLGELPADKYDFIIYEIDAHPLGELSVNPRFQIPRLIWFILNNRTLLGTGALEHNTSSFYFFPDLGKFGDEFISEFMPSTATHEFMHIVTPLTLHSQYVGNFDYENPIMSKHIWLYEGVTEYFAKLIPVHGGLITPKEFLIRKIEPKIRHSAEFPEEEMTFFEFSENVLEKKYGKHYGVTVQERGAVLGMLLDIEIIRLTDGEKTLIDVIKELGAKYGADKSFDEDSFIDEFVSLVHPDLKAFFERYHGGHEELPYAEVLDHVGITYAKDVTEPKPIHAIRDNDIKYKRAMIGGIYHVKKVGKDVSGDFRKGDRIDGRYYRALMYDENVNYVAEGTEVEIPVVRDGKNIKVSYTVEHEEKETGHKLTINTDMTDQQARYYRRWLGLDAPDSESVAE